MDPDEKTSIRNGIHLCKTHARLIDVDVKQYTVEELLRIKHNHELRIRQEVLPPSQEYDPEFLSSHETQVRHGRGNPSMSDLWVSRRALFQHADTSIRQDPIDAIRQLRGILAIVADQGSGRTSLLKRAATELLHKRNCIWLHGRDLTATALRDPLAHLATGYRKINQDSEAWFRFLEASPDDNLILIDDFQLSPLNSTAKRRLLQVLRSWSPAIVLIVSAPILLEMLSETHYEFDSIQQCELLDLSREACIELAEKWCRFRAETTSDDDLDRQTAIAEDQLELLLGRRLLPRRPVIVLTALQMIDAGSPLDTLAGGLGGVYEAVIHAALAYGAKSQAGITSERSYLEELAYWCEFHGSMKTRDDFESWFAERKAVHPAKVAELRKSLDQKGFLSPHHAGFRFHYQKYYFLASFLRDNPNRSGVAEYMSGLIQSCWNEDYANTALFLAYLHPASPLLATLRIEVDSQFAKLQPLDIGAWNAAMPITHGMLSGVDLSQVDARENRRLLAARLDAEAPTDQAICDAQAFQGGPQAEVQPNDILDLVKACHLVKLLGQFLRNSPVAIDAEQKELLVASGFALALRMAKRVTLMFDQEVLQRLAIGDIRDSILRSGSRTDIELELSGIACQLAQMIVFSILRSSCMFMAHADLDIIYRRVLSPSQPPNPEESYRIISCGIKFELRQPDLHLLRKAYPRLTRTGQDMVRMWARHFLAFNRSSVPKRQAIMSALEMRADPQLLLPSA